MGTLRSLLHRKRSMFRGVSVVFAVAMFTLITLVSCAGVTRPCLDCQRAPASDPFAQAEEIVWSSDSKDSSEEEPVKRRGRSNRGELTQ